MVFRTIDIKKDSSNTRKRRCNYSFEVILDVYAKKDDVFEVFVYAAEVFLDKRYAGIGVVQSDNSMVSLQIRDFPERRQKRFIKDMEIFVQRLRERTGTLYSFNIQTNEIPFEGGIVNEPYE